MAQIRSGLVDVENGSVTVTAVGADWTEVTAGDIFVVKSNNVPYFVATITEVAEDEWELTLSAPYAQATATSQQYAIANSFTEYMGIPLIAPGDIETATIFTRAMTIIDAELADLAAGGGGGSGTISIVSQTDDGVTVSISSDLIDAETSDSVSLILT